MTPPEPKLNKDGINRIIQVIITTMIIGGVVLLSAWRLDWTHAWIFIGLYTAILVLNTIIILRVNPEVINARGRVKKDTKQWDKVWAAVSTPATLAVYVVSGLDGGRFGWSSPPVWTYYLGIALFVISWVFTIWSLAHNRFFEKTVRIQEETGHQAVTTGPYAIIRHPGYFGFILLYYSTSLMLDSLWGLLPGFILMILYILRTAREDRTLHNELPGYPEYTQKVRYRLFPGIW